MIRIHQIYLSLSEDQCMLKEKCAKKLHIPMTEIKAMRIYRESIDARKHEVRFSYTIDLEVNNEDRLLHKKGVEQTPELSYQEPSCGTETGTGRIIVAGFGPAGMFSALLLAQMGYQPLVLERGEAIEQRVKRVEEFWDKGVLDINSNVQFGEGGAGTFSDGKLTTRSKDLRSRKVLEELVRFGAPEHILYEAHPHIGTDLLRGIVKRIREEIIQLGGEIRFSSPMEEIVLDQGHISAVITKGECIPCRALILAIGHSARDTFELLYKHNVELVQKSFAVGVRIEHPQALINEAQYKEHANHPKLKAAEYRLTHTTTKGRGVYTFCMCPGGSVVASASEAGGIVVNGMSEHARDKENANSAVLVQVHPEDVGSHILDGIKFQRSLEQAAFRIAGSNYHAPAQLVKDFLNNTPSTQQGSVSPTYLPGIALCNLHDILPAFVSEALLEALPAFDRKLHGFCMEDAIMTGVETRSSSPIRITRESDTLISKSIDNMYPSGEGAGYAGGIVSAAIDGLRCAEKVIERFSKPH